ncbi:MULTISPECIES: hypothetical protein [unclassified Variovorax]|uniref:hypothetical protein n=1 Tax=unclassified Variovorax TaxID=663243 RepID=UPI00076DE598|nr:MULTISPECIES: hypothetical protein [unclassified Variovorax]KWT95529.1 hypothetical protein APY03_2406 [Variovorax sp. WDL1]PNG50133.1 hypothetical protein CHC06_05756 [Variovorax sp. B2]PNG51006.1 hypothetical protein CHC07_05662 [Variovorax sp. B4]VTU42003.1 hypothetical protein SRS16P1_00173 [Variovorax sp. SRS16]VTU42037.1 hypothetical protein E5P1_00171 [Variovorax sp. PBL-E5]
MTQQAVQARPVAQPRESASFTSVDFDRMVAFAYERGWQEMPFHFVVKEWARQQILH